MRIRTSLLFVLVVAFALVLAGCGGKTTASAPSKPAAESPAADEPAPVPAESASVAMGQPATSGSWIVVVTETERESSTGGIDAGDGNELFVIKFDLKNGGSADEGIGPTSWVLADAQGVTYQAAQTSDDKFIFNTPQPINAGETREIRIAYEVPRGAGPFTWTFTPFVEGGATPAVLEVQ